MLSKNEIKFINRLGLKKYRLQEGSFVVEGIKTINELLQSKFKLQHLYTTKSFNINAKLERVITESDLRRISFLKNPNIALAVFKIPENHSIDEQNLIVATDDVRDPGNLGTIIRLCDWFGVKDIVCSKHTVDCFNPKVLQATMGSIARVNITYLDLESFLNRTKLPVFGALLDGENVYKCQLPESAILLMGNEANGISETTKKHVDKAITIPRFGALKAAESLNVATASAILLSEFRR